MNRHERAFVGGETVKVRSGLTLFPPAEAPPPTAAEAACTVTVQAASAATLAETLPSSVRSIEFCRAPITM